MTTTEKLLEEARGLSEFQLREVLDFVGFLKSRMTSHAIASDAAAAEADWAELEKGAGLWSGTFKREDCYDRAVLR